MIDVQESVLVPIQMGGITPPLFYIHGLFGDTQAFVNIAPMMNSEQRVYGLNAIGLQPDQEPDPTIEAMAARYVAALRQEQPYGPYYLGGFCYGGIIAYEIARQLDLLGEEVALLVIIEGAAPKKFHEKLPFFHPQRLRLSREALPQFLSGNKAFGGWKLKERIPRTLGIRRRPQPQGKRKVKAGTEFNDLAGGDAQAAEKMRERYMRIRHSLFKAPRPEAQLRVEAVHRRALQEYVPQPFSGRVTLIRARFKPIGPVMRGKLDPRNGWGSLAKGGVDIRYVDGTHSGCLRMPYVTELAAELRDALHEAQAAYR